jgi:uncharacterized protein (TIGR02757 family)
MRFKAELEYLYEKYNQRRYIHPDPLEFLYHYKNKSDREIVGLVASALAYGRVNLILRTVTGVLAKMGESPFLYLTTCSDQEIKNDYSDFKYRFTTSEEIVAFLLKIKKILRIYGSIYDLFLEGYRPEDEDIISSLKIFLEKFSHIDNAAIRYSSLIPDPSLCSALKRMNLYLRWMVRQDNVDPGGWEAVSASQLVIPLDTHMYRICCDFCFTEKKSPNLHTARQIMKRFKEIAPDDPVKYDFMLTRLGMNKKMELDELAKIGNPSAPGQ